MKVREVRLCLLRCHLVLRELDGHDKSKTRTKTKRKRKRKTTTMSDIKAKTDKIPRTDSNKKKGRSLKEAAMRNPTALGDPVSLKAEGSDTEPTEHDRGALRDGEDEKRERRRGSKL